MISQQKDVCIGNFLELAQYIVVTVQNVKIFTTFCPNDSSFESNRLLFRSYEMANINKVQT